MRSVSKKKFITLFIQFALFVVVVLFKYTQTYIYYMKLMYFYIRYNIYLYAKKRGKLTVVFFFVVVTESVRLL